MRQAELCCLSGLSEVGNSSQVIMVVESGQYQTELVWYRVKGRRTIVSLALSCTEYLMCKCVSLTHRAKLPDLQT